MPYLEQGARESFMSDDRAMLHATSQTRGALEAFIVDNRNMLHATSQTRGAREAFFRSRHAAYRISDEGHMRLSLRPSRSQHAACRISNDGYVRLSLQPIATHIGQSRHAACRILNGARESFIAADRAIERSNMEDVVGNLA